MILLEEKEVLDAFLFTCNQMRNSGFGKLFSVSNTKTYRVQENTPRSTRLAKKFSHDEWLAFLIPFRKLLLNDEPGNLLRVINTLSKNGSKLDQIRLREIKRQLKVAATSSGYGVHVLTEKEGQWNSLDGKMLLEKYINNFIFHNNSQIIASEKPLVDFHPFALSTLFHYVIFTYKQALRIEGAIRIRYGV